MNYGIILYILGYALKIEAGLMILPAIVGFIYKEKAAFAFLRGAALAFAVGTAMSYKKPKNQTNNYYFSNTNYYPISGCN